jgi:hypothetical protein
MMRYRPTIARISVVALHVALAPMALACGFDGLLGDQFSAQHGKSLPVAFAINDAVASGAFDKDALAPIEPGQKGYWRAMTRLQRFAQLLAETVDRDKLPAISVLLIDSRLWTRLRPALGGYEIEAHAPRPAPNDVVIVTNEFVLSGMIEGRLSPLRALDLGVVALDGAGATFARNEMLARLAPVNDGPMARKLLSPWGRRATNLK